MAGVLEAFLGGREARRVQDAANQANAMNAFLQQNGQAVFNGDPNALGQLAGMGPQGLETAFNVRGQMEDRSRTAKMDARDDEKWRMTVEEYAASKTAAERAAEAAQIEEGVKMGLGATTPQQWDQLVTQAGAEELVGQFENREAIAQRYMSVAEILKGQQPQGPLSGPGKIQADINAGILPADTPLRGPGSSVTINNGGTDKQIFDTLKESADAARAAETGLRALGEAQTALSSQGGVITGAGADLRLNAAKLGALLGVTDPTIISNTETFRSAIAPQVAAVMKATVGSAQISNADREFAEKAAGGSIALDRSSINRLLGIMEKAAMIAIDRHNAKLDAVYPDGQGFDRERALFGIQGGAPQGVPPAVQPAPDQAADDLTPEERQYLGLE
jgi:hypothetical protein